MNLNQVTIASANTEKSDEFYSQLGLIKIVDALPNYARYECPNGESTFSIHHLEDYSAKEGVTLYFETEELDKTVDQLKLKGFNFTSDPEDKPWLWREAHMLDPDGHKIILFQAGDNRKNPPWRIN
jgi:catechol 2,3-dioxygenase-like lactoylglutathione lyase family enzyme